MAREVAFFQNNLAAAALGEQGILTVYRRRQKVWEVEREKAFSLNLADGLRGFRDNIGEMVEFLAECKIVVASKVSGVIYYELEKAGCSIWEMDGYPSDSLDELWERSQPSCDEATLVIEVPVPVESSPGQYSISIKKMQEGNYGITSKQILMPVISKGTFKTLEIVCNHVPPWLEGQLALGAYVWEITRISVNECKVLIKR